MRIMFHGKKRITLKNFLTPLRGNACHVKFNTRTGFLIMPKTGSRFLYLVVKDGIHLGYQLTECRVGDSPLGRQW